MTTRQELYQVIKSLEATASYAEMEEIAENPERRLETVKNQLLTSWKQYNSITFVSNSKTSESQSIRYG